LRKYVKKALESDGENNSSEEIELLEKAVFNKLKKKRSVKEYKKLGVTKKADLKEINRTGRHRGLRRAGGSIKL